MAKCHLIIDSCCDLPASVVRRPGVTLMKFPYTVDGGTFEDDLFESVSAEAFYGAMRKGAEPSTAQVTLQTLTDTFTAAAEEGTPAVYLAFSSGLSASFDAACVVRDQVLAEPRTSSCISWTPIWPAWPTVCSSTRRWCSTRRACRLPSWPLGPRRPAAS